MLTSKCLKGVVTGYPLKLVVRTVVLAWRFDLIWFQKLFIMPIDLHIFILFNRPTKLRMWTLILMKILSNEFYQKWTTMFFEILHFRWVVCKLHCAKKTLIYFFCLYQIKLGIELPNEKDQSESEEFLNKIHHALFEVEIVVGDLIWPETGRKFAIKDGIPNMLCTEEEV